MKNNKNIVMVMLALFGASITMGKGKASTEMGQNAWQSPMQQDQKSLEGLFADTSIYGNVLSKYKPNYGNAARLDSNTIAQTRDMLGRYKLSESLFNSVADPEGLNNFNRFKKSLETILATGSYGASISYQTLDTARRDIDQIKKSMQSILQSLDQKAASPAFVLPEMPREKDDDTWSISSGDTTIIPRRPRSSSAQLVRSYSGDSNLTLPDAVPVPVEYLVRHRLVTPNPGQQSSPAPQPSPVRSPMTLAPIFIEPAEQQSGIPSQAFASAQQPVIRYLGTTIANSAQGTVPVYSAPVRAGLGSAYAYAPQANRYMTPAQVQQPTHTFQSYLELPAIPADQAISGAQVESEDSEQDVASTLWSFIEDAKSLFYNYTEAARKAVEDSGVLDVIEDFISNNAPAWLLGEEEANDGEEVEQE